MKERLLEYLKYRKIGQNSFEKSVGWSNGTIYNLTNGIRSDKLASMAKICPDLNLRWLLLGEGEMLNNEKRDLYSQETTELKKDKERLIKDKEYLMEELSRVSKDNSKLISLLEVSQKKVAANAKCADAKQVG